MPYTNIANLGGNYPRLDPSEMMSQNSERAAKKRVHAGVRNLHGGQAVKSSSDNAVATATVVISQRVPTPTIHHRASDGDSPASLLRSPNVGKYFVEPEAFNLQHEAHHQHQETCQDQSLLNRRMLKLEDSQPSDSQQAKSKQRLRNVRIVLPPEVLPRLVVLARSESPDQHQPKRPRSPITRATAQQQARQNLLAIRQDGPVSVSPGVAAHASSSLRTGAVSDKRSKSDSYAHHKELARLNAFRCSKREKISRSKTEGEAGTAKAAQSDSHIIESMELLFTQCVDLGESNYNGSSSKAVLSRRRVSNCL